MCDHEAFGRRIVGMHWAALLLVRMLLLVGSKALHNERT